MASFTTSSSLLNIALLLLLHFFQTAEAKPHCTPSACGIIPNITSPFRLNNDPPHCGDKEFALACEHNVTFLYYNSHKFYVKHINYPNSSIRLADASIDIDNILSFPSFSAYNFHGSFRNDSRACWPVNFMSCPNQLKTYDPSLFTNVTRCSSNHSSRNRYVYATIGAHMHASDVAETCTVEATVMTSWEFKDVNNVSLSEIHDSLVYGFELTFCHFCIDDPIFPFTIWDLLLSIVVSVGLLCGAVSPPLMPIFGFAALSLLICYIGSFLFYSTPENPHLATYPRLVADFIILVPRFMIFPMALWLLICKFRRRHLSTYNNIESFLQSDNKLTPIRYSYSNIKKMTRGFRDKLGEGGYGCVYKGKLRSGHHVAVKLLGKSGASGQDFMNEMSTIGKIHHVNVVKLVGYCAQGSKRALVFDFMPNGSLDKYIYNRENMSSLDWDTKFKIAIGVAHGIEYLHRGCDVQILHFDIKPHNILLDDNFVPKISDFGLAKLFSTDKKTVTMTAVRGTIGYVAPELINRSIGAVSYKADVYSFGMLLMEMVSLNRDLAENNDNSSKYFPYWIYDYFNQGKDIEFMGANENEDNGSMMELARKMTIVALWCIQMNPDDRPSMKKALEMLEADVERLRIPNYPSQSTQTEVHADRLSITSSADSASSLHHDDASLSVEIVVEDFQSRP